MMTLGCDRVVYPQRVDVLFRGHPVITRGARVRFKDVTIGRVAVVSVFSDQTVATIDVAPDQLPRRAAFVPADDQTGRVYLEVYSLPGDSDDGRARYRGAKNKAELIGDVVQGGVEGTVAHVSDCVLQLLGIRVSDK